LTGFFALAAFFAFGAFFLVAFAVFGLFFLFFGIPSSS
jgi:hypothetical protein